MGSSRIGKSTLNTSLSQSQLASSGSSKMFKRPGVPASASQPSVKLVGSNQGEPKPVVLQKPGGPNGLEDIRQPSQTLHAQMQARVQAQLLQAKQEEPLVPSESIELPDINSEYVCSIISCSQILSLRTDTRILTMRVVHALLTLLTGLSRRY